MLSSSAAPVLSRRDEAAAPGVRGLLFTVLGEFVLPGDGTAWTSALLAVRIPDWERLNDQ